MSTKTTLARTLYRLLLRQSRDMSQQSIAFPFKEPMDMNAWLVHGGSPRFVPCDPAYAIRAQRERLPWLELNGNGIVSGPIVSSVTKDYFRKDLEGSETIEERIDRAFDAIRVLEEQKYLARMSNSTVTNGIVVDVTTMYVGTQRDLDPFYDDEDGELDPPKYYYTYRIRVSNHGSKPVQLLSRHWKVYGRDSDLQMEVAPGARGVVGQTPIIKPNTCFSYYSGTDIDGKGGSMEGSFGMVILDDDGKNVEEFDAKISRFPFS